MTKVIALANQKGGMGKTTTAMISNTRMSSTRQKNMRLFLIKWPGRAHCLFIIGVEVFINAHSRKGCSLKLAAERQITVTGVEPKPLPFQ